jgi:hypothetical protein
MSGDNSEHAEAPDREQTLSATRTTPAPDSSPESGLLALLDHALAMTADRLTHEQRGELWRMVEATGLAAVIQQSCSPDVQRVLLSDQPRVNPDGGAVGQAVREGRENTGASVAHGSAKVSATPTA